MTKHTNKNTINKLFITFKDPNLLKEFNDLIETQYGSIRGNRIQVIEELFREYIQTQKIEKAKPEFIEKMKNLQKEVQELNEENVGMTKKYESEIKRLCDNLESKTNTIHNLEDSVQEMEHLQEDNKKNENTIDELNKKILELSEENKQLIQSYETTLTTQKKKYESEIEKLRDNLTSKTIEVNNLNHTIKEKEHIEEDNKKNENIIDELNKKLEKNIGKYEDSLIHHTEEIKKLNGNYITKLEGKDEEIKQLNEDYLNKIEGKDEELKSKEKEIKDLNNKKDVLLLKINALEKDINDIKNMGWFDRLMGNYPEEKPIELKP